MTVAIYKLTRKQGGTGYMQVILDSDNYHKRKCMASDVLDEMNGTLTPPHKWTNPFVFCEYKQMESVPYIDSTIYRIPRQFGRAGNIVVVENNYVDQECGVLFVTFRCKDSSAGISMPIGVFGYYFSYNTEKAKEEQI